MTNRELSTLGGKTIELLLGRDISEEQKRILSKKRNQGVGALTNYEGARLMANHTLTSPYIDQNNKNGYAIFEQHVEEIKEAMEIMNLREGLSSRFYGIVLGKEQLRKVEILKKVLTNGKALTNNEISELENHFNAMEDYLATNYEESDGGFTRYDNKGNKMHFIPKEGVNGEAWNGYAKLMNRVINSKQVAPEPERDHRHKTTTLSTTDDIIQFVA